MMEFWKILGLREENLGFDEENLEIGHFGVCRSNAPQERSNAKAKGKSRPLAIRTPLSGVRTPRPGQWGVRTVLWAFERLGTF